MLTAKLIFYWSMIVLLLAALMAVLGAVLFSPGLALFVLLLVILSGILFFAALEREN